MEISKNGLALIKDFEGCGLEAYRCPAGVVTIGYGETGTFTLTGKKIVMGMKVTQEQANKSLSLRLEKRRNYAAVKNLGVDFNQNQFDALVSFCYNLGVNIFTGNLRNAIKNKDWQDVARQMLLYNKARVNGKLTELKGLTRRRQAESELFLKPVEETDQVLYEACRALILHDINININAWKRMDLINLNNADSLIRKLGGIDKITQQFASKGVNFNAELWQYSIAHKSYTKENIRSLIIKYADSLG